jgi:hypothetical protein
MSSRRRLFAAVTGGVVAAAMAAMLVVELPAASTLGSRTAHAAELRQESAFLADQAAAYRALAVSTQQRVDGATTQTGRLTRRASHERKVVAGLKKQVASLQRDVKALGG